MDYKTYENLPVSGQYYAALGVIDALAKKLGPKFEAPSKKMGRKYPTMQVVYPVAFLMKCDQRLRENWDSQLDTDATEHLFRILVFLIASIPEDGIKRLDTAYITTYYRAVREATEEIQEEIDVCSSYDDVK